MNAAFLYSTLLGGVHCTLVIFYSDWVCLISVYSSHTLVHQPGSTTSTNPQPPAYHGSADSLMFGSSLLSQHELATAFQTHCNQIFIGMISMQYQAQQVSVDTLPGPAGGCACTTRPSRWVCIHYQAQQVGVHTLPGPAVGCACTTRPSVHTLPGPAGGCAYTTRPSRWV